MVITSVSIRLRVQPTFTTDNPTVLSVCLQYWLLLAFKARMAVKEQARKGQAKEPMGTTRCRRRRREVILAIHCKRPAGTGGCLPSYAHAKMQHSGTCYERIAVGCAGGSHRFTGGNRHARTEQWQARRVQRWCC